MESQCHEMDIVFVSTPPQRGGSNTKPGAMKFQNLTTLDLWKLALWKAHKIKSITK